MLAGAASAAVPRFPTLSARNLNDETVRLPGDLPGSRTLLLIAFKQEQQFDIDTWIEGLALRTSTIPWLELPVVPNFGAVFRWYLDNAMRSGIRETAARERVVTIYTDTAAFRSTLAIPSDDRIHALVVTRTGRILARAEGRYRASSGAPILAALNDS
jgi:hypothetical protein